MNWQEKETRLEKSFEFKDFSEAFAFVCRVALEAEKMNHHPEIRLDYNKLLLRLCTHEGGERITDKDYTLAERIDRLAQG